jgi:single-strand DNA-binding protein
MNSCILMADITKDPELRYLADNQTAITEMWVQFPNSTKPDDIANLKVVGWRNLAQDIKDHYHRGDRVLIEGKLKIETAEKDGYKEKRAEFIASRVHLLNRSGEIPQNMPVYTVAESTNVVNLESRRNNVSKPPSPQDDDLNSPVTPTEDLDSIPF